MFKLDNKGFSLIELLAAMVILIILFSSILKISPSPVQAGQAPKGLLKENALGVISSNEIPQSTQA